VWEFLFKGRVVIGNGSISQVRPEDKMATNLQNGDIIVLSISAMEIGILSVSFAIIFPVEDLAHECPIIIC
jgi:hypothetical protein